MQQTTCIAKKPTSNTNTTNKKNHKNHDFFVNRPRALWEPNNLAAHLHWRTATEQIPWGDPVPHHSLGIKKMQNALSTFITKFCYNYVPNLKVWEVKEFVGFFYLAGIRDTPWTDLKYFTMSRNKSEKRDLDLEQLTSIENRVGFLYSCSVDLYTTQVNLLIK